MHQAVTLPTAEITTAINLAAAATTFQACEPLSLAAEAGCAVCEWHKLVDLDPNAVAIGDAVPKPQAISLSVHGDRCCERFRTSAHVRTQGTREVGAQFYETLIAHAVPLDSNAQAQEQFTWARCLCMAGT